MKRKPSAADSAAAARFHLHETILAAVLDCLIGAGRENPEILGGLMASIGVHAAKQAAQIDHETAGLLLNQAADIVDMLRAHLPQGEPRRDLN